jgi:hypothetical protein
VTELARRADPAITAERDEMFAAMQATRARLHYRRPGEVPQRCGRPTKAGTPCGNRRMPEQDDLGAIVVGLEHRGYIPPSCAKHGTDEEYAEHQRIRAATGEILAAGRRAFRAAERVHCWDWPVTHEHRERMAEIAATEDEDEDEGEIRRLSMRLLADWQDGRCGICATTHGAHFLDHSHETGMVRGYLCKCCNTGEGFRTGEPESVYTRYGERNPASILGLKIRYHSPFTGWAEPEPPRDGQAYLDNHPAYVLARLLSGEG